jgi:hypothetical protein
VLGSRCCGGDAGAGTVRTLVLGSRCGVVLVKRAMLGEAACRLVRG